MGYVDDRHWHEGLMGGKERNGFQSRRQSEQLRIYATAPGGERCMTTERTFTAGCGRKSVSASDAPAQFIPQFRQLVAIVLNLQPKTN